MPVAFTTVKPVEDYTPPAKRDGDSDRAHAVYVACHRAAKTCTAVKLAEDGQVVSATSRKGALVDMGSASVIVAVADALNEANRAKFLNMPIARMGTLAWRLA